MLVNGSSSPERDTDFIGGAELTEIPWLRNTDMVATHNGAASDLRTESTSVIDGPRGAGSVETVTVNVNGLGSIMPATDQPVTQGEQLRQEQEVGVAPTGRVTRASTAASQAALRATGMLPAEEETAEETVHVRGPDVIGMEDMGPQAPGSGLEGGLDVEGALGRRGEGELVHTETDDKPTDEAEGKEALDEDIS